MILKNESKIKNSTSLNGKLAFDINPHGSSLVAGSA